MKVGLLILSDRGARGERPDSCAPLITSWLAQQGVKVLRTLVLPDERAAITATLREWCVEGGLDLIVTSGGTGVSPRDVTPEATLDVLERVLPGFGEEMRRQSLQKTPHAITSRGVAGVRGRTLIVNLPGSPKGAVENLAAVWPAIPHAVAKIQGDPSECADLSRGSLASRGLPPTVSFVARSGTGKTTLLERVIAILNGQGYRVGVIKHDAHRFDIDHPGKDSHRLTVAGAATMLITSSEKLALVKRHENSPSLEELVASYFGDVDVVLTEGFKGSGMPKIELHRQEQGGGLLCRGDEDDPTLLAVATDTPLVLDVPQLNLNDPQEVADFLVRRF
ncbi:MAG TPA: molybdopterin-guanine dinucleotide biosynthesis protein B, partial [Geobacterales bacterium]|nr:molybdopterin-guanine dinucleotide biosynthesis protein B [Geobacterales bacterium]